ncbi:MAG: transcriptional regulator [Dyadobacter sp.]|uniref:ArsR/SmtB family transcription factor n=1 Tax=Dyadobacter sp. TaxID=1914288 RepID=UPI00326649EA
MEEFENQFSEIAALLGDKSRAVMLWCLLDGRAYTASELAICANISAQSASNHLAKMINANMLGVEKQGRHRYYRYASAEVAQVIESMASLVTLSNEHSRIRKPAQNDFTYARTCYDHLAGKFGVDLTTSLVQRNMLRIEEKRYAVTPEGVVWFQSIGINPEESKSQKRSFAHQCLDWSERKHHLAGALGTSLLNGLMKNDWIRRKQFSREIIITPTGKLQLSNSLGLEF